VEDAVASGADRFVAVDLAWADYPYGRFLVEHDSYLHRGGVGSEEHVGAGVAAGDEKGVLHVASGVVGRKVEQVEVVAVELQFGAGCDAESHG